MTDSSKYITIESDIVRIENCMNAIDSLIIIDKFKEYGRHAYLYDRHYNGGKNAKCQVRKTVRNAFRLANTIHKKLDMENLDQLKKVSKIQIRFLQLQMLFV